MLIAAGATAGALGGLLGIGGGIFLTPILVIAFHIPVEWAVPASLVCIAATSLASAPRHHASAAMNNRIGMLLALGAATGGVSGGIIAKFIPQTAVLILLSALAFLAAGLSLFAPEPIEDTPSAFAGEGADEWPGTLGGTYLGPTGAVPYKAVRPAAGVLVASFAGLSGAIAGVGGGFLNVPQMRLVMGLPVRVSAATSTFVVGISASSALVIYMAGGRLAPALAGPLLIGSSIGALAGSALMQRIHGPSLHRILVAVLVIVGVQVAWGAIG